MPGTTTPPGIKDIFRSGRQLAREDLGLYCGCSPRVMLVGEAPGSIGGWRILANRAAARRAAKVPLDAPGQCGSLPAAHQLTHQQSGNHKRERRQRRNRILGGNVALPGPEPARTVGVIGHRYELVEQRGRNTDRRRRQAGECRKPRGKIEVARWRGQFECGDGRVGGGTEWRLEGWRGRVDGSGRLFAIPAGAAGCLVIATGLGDSRKLRNKRTAGRRSISRTGIELADNFQMAGADSGLDDAAVRHAGFRENPSGAAKSYAGAQLAARHPVARLAPVWPSRAGLLEFG
jgi:hypothetical protein